MLIEKLTSNDFVSFDVEFDGVALYYEHIEKLRKLLTTAIEAWKHWNEHFFLVDFQTMNRFFIDKKYPRLIWVFFRFLNLSLQ